MCEVCQPHQKNFDKDIWKKDICFYLDGKSFVHKLNPKDQARAPKAREWRGKNEGLTPDCVAIGIKVGSGGKVAHFMVVISYQNGVMCEQYEKTNDPHFSDFVKWNFRQMLRNSVNPNSMLWMLFSLFLAGLIL